MIDGAEIPHKRKNYDRSHFVIYKRKEELVLPTAQQAVQPSPENVGGPFLNLGEHQVSIVSLLTDDGAIEEGMTSL